MNSFLAMLLDLLVLIVLVDDRQPLRAARGPVPLDGAGPVVLPRDALRLLPTQLPDASLLRHVSLPHRYGGLCTCRKASPAWGLANQRVTALLAVAVAVVAVGTVPVDEAVVVVLLEEAGALHLRQHPLDLGLAGVAVGQGEEATDVARDPLDGEAALGLDGEVAGGALHRPVERLGGLELEVLVGHLLDDLPERAERLGGVDVERAGGAVVLLHHLARVDQDLDGALDAVGVDALVVLLVDAGRDAETVERPLAEHVQDGVVEGGELRLLVLQLDEAGVVVLVDEDGEVLLLDVLLVVAVDDERVVLDDLGPLERPAGELPLLEGPDGVPLHQEAVDVHHAVVDVPLLLHQPAQRLRHGVLETVHRGEVLDEEDAHVVAVVTGDADEVLRVLDHRSTLLSRWFNRDGRRGSKRRARRKSFRPKGRRPRRLPDSRKWWHAFPSSFQSVILLYLYLYPHQYRIYDTAQTHRAKASMIDRREG